MGNFRFRLSNMMPNAWLCKLKDMSKTTNHCTNKKSSKFQKSKHSEQNQSYFYYTIETNKEKHYNSPRNPKISETHVQFPEPSRKSSKKTRRRTIYKPSPKHTSTTSYSAFIEPDSSTESSTELDIAKSSSFEFESDTLEGFNGLASFSSSCKCRISSSTADIIIDMNENQYKAKFEKFDDFSEFSELNLPPIQTKLPNSKDTTEYPDFRYIENMKIKKERRDAHVLPRKSTGFRVRTKSPKFESKRFKNKSRNNASLEKASRTQNNKFPESFAVVKVSIDPEKDFRNSMIEMIAENNIRTSKELEELLACFLSLNSEEYHDVIIKVFEQIWFSMSKIHL